MSTVSVISVPSLYTETSPSASPLFVKFKNLSCPLTLKLIVPPSPVTVPSSPIPENSELSVLTYFHTGFLLSKSTYMSVASFECPSVSEITPAGILIFILYSSSKSSNLITKL